LGQAHDLKKFFYICLCISILITAYTPILANLF
jgi:hypothetical protein